MTGPSEAIGIDEVSLRLAALIRARVGPAAVDVAAPEELQGTVSTLRVQVVLHRIALDPMTRSDGVTMLSPDAASPGAARPGGAAPPVLPARLGYLVVARGADAATEQRTLTAVLSAISASPVLGETPRWMLTVEAMDDERAARVFSALRVPLRPCVWCEARGVLA